MKILVSGSTGLVGSALVPYLKGQGLEVVRLVRRAGELSEGEVFWDPERGVLQSDDLSGVEAAVHLAGESIGAKRWSAAQKQRIRDSRVKGTLLLSEALARLEPVPKVLASASAMGFYGDQGDKVLAEDDSPGHDFLADVTQAWEEATSPASNTSTRVVNMRFGLVLDAKADLIRKTLPLFKLGLGGRLGNGRQFMSWITLSDLTCAIGHVLVTPSLSGPVNMSSPNPVTNRDFTSTLGRILSRPTIFAVPALALKLGVGEMAESMLCSTRMSPNKLIESGFEFDQPELEAALREVLGKP
ncbi:MAG: TIGR01777 family protein [SAR202 cluster bacterium Casp-Chloro-G4]|nr:TIGR01777 family oxidoreductase [Chloroflexota bacterium]MDA1227403.1 TIGR01777 family oxidoreductase [Chloroflexota bacterium]PKB62152.1 MAG: TIGR01777 family protein [SAR202 cluster bacterium Casp-Chloro-G4]